MEPISDARSTMALIPSDRLRGYVTFAACLAGQKARAEAAQLIQHTSIDELVTDPRDDAADDRRVGLEAELHVAPNDPAQPIAYDRLSLVVERLGSSHVRDRDALRIEHHGLELLDQVRHRIEASALQQETSKVSNFRLAIRER